MKKEYAKPCVNVRLFATCDITCSNIPTLTILGKSAGSYHTVNVYDSLDAVSEGTT